MTKRRSHFLESGIPADPRSGLVIEEGPEGKGVGPWVPADKHRYLCEYLWATRHAWASKKWSGRVLLDPFCGPGRIRVQGETQTRDGGVIAAWRESVANNVPFTRVLVGDKDPERVEACVARLRALGAPVEGLAGPASETVPQLAAHVPPGALTFAYVDPYNLSLLSFDLFQALARLRVDVAAHFSTMDLVRNVELEFDLARDRFDATAPGWRTDPGVLASSKRNVPLAFLMYWQRLVQGLGYHSSNAMPLIHNREGHAIYRLVFFSVGEWPQKIWGDVGKADPAQGALF